MIDVKESNAALINVKEALRVLNSYCNTRRNCNEECIFGLYHVCPFTDMLDETTQHEIESAIDERVEAQEE